MVVDAMLVSLCCHHITTPIHAFICVFKVFTSRPSVRLVISHLYLTASVSHAVSSEVDLWTSWLDSNAGGGCDDAVCSVGCTNDVTDRSTLEHLIKCQRKYSGWWVVGREGVECAICGTDVKWSDTKPDWHYCTAFRMNWSNGMPVSLWRWSLWHVWQRWLWRRPHDA